MKNFFVKSAFVALLFLMSEVSWGKSHFDYYVTINDSNYNYLLIPNEVWYANPGDTVNVKGVYETETDSYWGPFDWYRDSIFFINTGILHITQNGKYYAHYDKSWSFNIVFGSPTAIHDLSSDESLKIYPNPFSNSLHVSLNLEKPAAVDFKLFDVTGNQIHSSAFASASQLNEEVDLAFLPEGVYVAVLTMGDKKVARRVIKGR